MIVRQNRILHQIELDRSPHRVLLHSDVQDDLSTV